MYNAVWNDYAELYLKQDPDEVIEPGTVICKVKGKSCYTSSNQSNLNLVVGVCSDSYGYLVGGDENLTYEENLKKYVPVSMTGRVMVKVPKGVIIEEGDILSADINGCAYPRDVRGQSIGKALESSDGSKDKILMQVFLG